MLLKEAELKAAEIMGPISPWCEKILVVGSVRRKKTECKDIDILLIPKNYLTAHAEILKLGPTKVDGPQITRVDYQGIQVDFYYATPATWGTLVLIRTGSQKNNMRLCELAKRKGWQLKASGEGLIDGAGTRLASDREEDIFSALGLKYIPPEQRA